MKRLAFARACSTAGWTPIIAIVNAGIFAVSTALVTARATGGVDLRVTTAIQGASASWLDAIASVHTVVGHVAVTLPLAAMLAIFVRRRSRGRAWIGPLFILATLAIEVVLKFAVAHPPPPNDMTRMVSGADLLWDTVPPYAFPSGHVARVTFLAVVLGSLIGSPRYRVAAVAFVAFSVFARVYVGDHWISDTLGGLGLGALVGSIAVLWMRAQRLTSAAASR